MAKEKELEQVEGQQLPVENKVESLIRVIRGQQVMLDRDLAELYGVETKRLNEQVKRNIERFPEDFMFQLTSNEFDNLKSQFATSSWGGVRKLPYAFTEQGVAMLSGVWKSTTAVEANIRIMRAFVSMRHFMVNNVAFYLFNEKVPSGRNATWNYDVLFSFFLEELLEEVHLLLILNRSQMQSFLHNHHRWFTFLVGSPERKAIPIWIASLGKVDPVA